MKEAQLLNRPATAMAGYILATVLGALLLPLLSGALGSSGMAYVALAMPAYHFLTAAGSLIFPTIIGRMLAPLLENGEHGKARTLFADSLLALVLPGAALGVVTAVLAAPVASLCSLAGGGPSLVGIAPLFLLSMAAAPIRGYFIAARHFDHYALSLIVQQLGKVLFSSLLAGLGNENPAAMAQWACFGICIAEGLSLLVSGLLFMLFSRKGSRREGQSGAMPIGTLAVRLWAAGGLAALLAALPSLLSVFDALVIPGRFDAALTNPGIAAGGYAQLAAFGLPVVLFPGVMCAILALLGLNGIAAAKSMQDYTELSARAAFSIKSAFLLSIPAAIAVGILAKPLLSLLFPAVLTGAQLDAVAELVLLLAAGLVFAAVGLTCALQLCATGYTFVGIVNAAIAVLIKLILTLLLATPERTVFGGAFATVVALFAFCACNMVQALRRSRARFEVVNTLVKPAICAFCMGTAMYFLHFALLEKLMGAAGCILAILGGYLIYIALGVATRILAKDDFERLPFGLRLYDILSGIGMVK